MKLLIIKNSKDGKWRAGNLYVIGEEITISIAANLVKDKVAQYIYESFKAEDKILKDYSIK